MRHLDIRRLLLPLVLLFAMAGAAQAGDDEAMTLYFRAAITIEADGTLSRIEWDDAGKIPPVLRDRLDARVRGWTYQPGTVEGIPATTESTLRLRVRAEPVGEGVTVHVEEASTGPRMVLVPPDYPREALRRGASASVLALLHVAADGSREVEIADYVGDKYTRRKFEDAVRHSLAGVDVALEVVGGQVAPATLHIPVEFCTGDGPLAPCDSHPWPQLEAAKVAAAAPPGDPVPDGSVAAIASDVRGASI